MTGGDRESPRSGPAVGTSPPVALLVALEPAGDGKVSTDAVLTAEAARLAEAFGASVRLVTWAPGVSADPEGLAAAVARAAGGGAREGAPAAGIDGPLYAAVLLADTDLGRQLAPMVAERLGSGAVVGCSDILALREAPGGPPALVFVKPVYGGWLEREIEAAQGTIPVVTLDLTGMPEPLVQPEGVPAPEMLEIAVVASPTVRSLEVVPPDARTVDLVHAKRIVAAGSGSASDELLAAAGELAELLEGSVGATRPVVDDGLLPKERLIGQTGRTVNPELYVALGISGSPHHVAGVRKADKILSINRDARAPIFQFSDVGYVADLEEVLPALVRRIKEYRDASGGHE